MSIRHACHSRQKLSVLLLAQIAAAVVLTVVYLASIPDVQLKTSENLRHTAVKLSALDSGKLRVFVVQTPDYQHGASPQQMYGFAQLGNILDADSSMWTSYYEYQDCWWINQMNLSPLRVHDPESADIIFIAARFDTRRHNITEEIKSFMETANARFPLLGQKPHVICLNNPFFMYTIYANTLVSMPQSSQFTFISIETYSGPSGPSSANWITAPYMAHVHWHQGMPKQLPFNATLVQATKKRLAFMSGSRFQDHMSNKAAMRDSCIAHEEQCMYIQWTGEWESALAVFEGMRASWFTLMPRGDFITRNSLYDAIMAGSIPVVTTPDVSNYMPFSDLLDWDLGMLKLPRNAIEGIEVQSIDEDTAEQDSVSAAHMHDDDAALPDNTKKPFGNTATWLGNTENETAVQHGHTVVATVQASASSGQPSLIAWLGDTWDEVQTLAKQEFLHEHMHVMQYAINPTHEVIRFDEMFLERIEDDAFTFTWKAVLRNLCQRKTLPANRCEPSAIAVE